MIINVANFTDEKIFLMAPPKLQNMKIGHQLSSSIKETDLLAGILSLFKDLNLKSWNIARLTLKF